MEIFKLTDAVKDKIDKKVKEISNTLMRHENKEFCLEGISRDDWSGYIKNDIIYVIVPSTKFKKLILERGYLMAVQKNPELFGTGNPYNVIEAIQKNEKCLFPCLKPLQEYMNFLKQENLAYIFEVKNNKVSDRVLRLDLFRSIKDAEDGSPIDFLGGIFHAFKHFTIEEYETISYNKDKGYELCCWDAIIWSLILNFFSDDFQKEKPRAYIAYSKLSNSQMLRGVYYKENDIPVFFLNSLRRDAE